MSGRQLSGQRSARLSRRDFIAALGASASGASLLALAGACTSDAPKVTSPSGPMGSIRGSVVDATGAPRSVGRIFRLDKTGLNSGDYADVDVRGTFDFGEVKVGEYQLMYWGANLARVPEPLPNPVPITVAAGLPTVVRFQVDAADEGELTDRDINAGDYFFQEQPTGQPNATVEVKLGTLVCWYNVGTMLHTVSGGPWGDSGPLAHGENFMWKTTEVGTFPYRCNYHGARMLATLKVVP